MQALVVAWQLFELTKNPLDLGWIGFVEAVVFIAFSLWAGRFADKREKRGIILAAQGALFLCSLALLYLSLLPLNRFAIFAVIAVTGLARSYLWPASFAYSELTVPREIYARAAAWNSTGWEVGSVLGPAIGGLLLTWSGPVLAYGVVAALSLGGLGLALLMSPRPPDVATPEMPSGDLLSGIKFVFSNQVILAAISLDMFAVLFGGAMAILPMFAERFGVGPAGLGWLRAAPSVGAIVMALYQQYRPPYQKTGQALFLTVFLYGLATIAFALSTHFGVSLLLLALAGGFDNISVVIRASIMQAYTPNAMRGRVASVNGIFIGSSNEIGAFESGLAAKLMGAVPSVVFGGVMTLITVLLVYWKAPKLRQLTSIHR
jgi:predicted MFS family arabinose efflux permease